MQAISFLLADESISNPTIPQVAFVIPGRDHARLLSDNLPPSTVCLSIPSLARVVKLLALCLLEKLGCCVDVVDNGREAVAAVARGE